jgi:ABC-type dipeptide/oligopeptide/nickel transport system ATPase component
VFILSEGEVVEEGAANEVLTNPQHPATRAFLQFEHSAQRS